MKHLTTLICTAALLLSSCQSPYKKSLTFYASFDESARADFALGDPNIYTAKGSYVDQKRVLQGIEQGLHYSQYRISQGQGKYGKALDFGGKSDTVVFFKSEKNMAYDAENWSGTISFWLSVDPPNDIEGYTDPIQITDANFNDASIWVDFTHPAPNNFRLGVIGDKKAWTQDTLTTPVREVFNKRIANIGPQPFTRNSWTHVLITFKSLGTDQSESNLYINGEKKGTVSGVNDPFTWELSESNIYLALNYQGLMDELAIFNKPFTEQEVAEFHQLEGSVKSIL